MGRVKVSSRKVGRTRIHPKVKIEILDWPVGKLEASTNPEEAEIMNIPGLRITSERMRIWVDGVMYMVDIAVKREGRKTAVIAHAWEPDTQKPIDDADNRYVNYDSVTWILEYVEKLLRRG